MLTETPQPNNRSFTDTHGKAICHDCRTVPEDRHLNIVPASNRAAIYNTLMLGPNLRQLYDVNNDAICDACFLRRRLEGKL